MIFKLWEYYSLHNVNKCSCRIHVTGYTTVTGYCLVCIYSRRVLPFHWRNDCINTTQTSSSAETRPVRALKSPLAHNYHSMDAFGCDYDYLQQLAGVLIFLVLVLLLRVISSSPLVVEETCTGARQPSKLVSMVTCASPHAVSLADLQTLLQHRWFFNCTILQLQLIGVTVPTSIPLTSSPDNTAGQTAAVGQSELVSLLRTILSLHCTTIVAAY